jgi:hypothetical protein
MDIKNSLDYRYKNFDKYNNLGQNKYNYSEEGILCKCLPKILFKGNSVLVTFIQLIDLKLIMTFKYIDKIKRFKYITWYE